MGFSTMTSIPASSSGMVTAAWAVVGTATTAASTRPARSREVGEGLAAELAGGFAGAGGVAVDGGDQFHAIEFAKHAQVVAAEGPGADHRHADGAHASSGSIPTMAIRAASAAASISSLSISSVRPASTASAVVFVSFMRLNGSGPGDRHVEQQVLAAAGHLDQAQGASVHQRGGAAQHRVRAFHRFDGDAGALGDRNALADVEAGERVGRRGGRSGCRAPRRRRACGG